MIFKYVKTLTSALPSERDEDEGKEKWCREGGLNCT